jgi:short subunit dehydrogenase-like uncharacterized protein
MNKIVVFGATGYAGGLAVDALLRRGVRPVLAGRSDRLPELAHSLGALDHQFADIRDSASVRALVDGGDVLITTVGPFEQFGRVVAQAAAEVGAHYVDCTGEVNFVRHLRSEHGARARDAGTVMLAAFGYDYIPGTLASVLAMQEAPTAVKLDIGYFATGRVWPRGLSQGTRRTMVNEMTVPVNVWKDFALAQEGAASRSHHFAVNGHRKAAMLVTGTETLDLPALYPQLRHVSVYNGWMGGMTLPVVATSPIMQAMAKNAVSKKILEKVTSRLVGRSGGPNADERARTLTHAVAIASDNAGKVLAEVHVEGPSIYSLTAELLAWAGVRLADGKGKPGVGGPLDAFSFEDFVTGCADVGLRRV